MLQVLKRRLPDPAERLALALARADARFRRAFGRLVANVKNSWTLDLLASLIESGQMERALETVRLNAAHLGQAASQTFVQAGEAAAATAGTQVGIHIDFDQINDRAVSAMRGNSLRLVRAITQDQRDAINVVLTQGVSTGVNPVDTARRVRDVIGLTARQAQAVENYRRLLERGSTEALSRALRDRRFDPSVLSAAEQGRVIDPELIDRMVERYGQRYLRYRSEVIARTESQRSVHEGAREGFRQAVDSGRLPGEKIVRTWVTAHDDRVRDSHVEMDGQERGFDEPFESGDGNLLMYPGDPGAPPEETINCRCVVTTRLAR